MPNIETRISSVLEKVSTSAMNTPSTETRAMPVPGARPPIQPTEVPVKVKLARAPGSDVAAALPPLQVRSGAALQPALNATAGSVSSKRCTAAGGGGGGGGGGALATFTVTGAEVLLLPAASRATAVRACVPSLEPAVFHDTEYGAAVSSAPRFAPSSLNCTPTTPTLSDALALTVTVPASVAPPAGELMLTLGGAVSLNTVTVTGCELYCTPKRSRATAISVCVPLAAPRVFQTIEYGADVSSAPRFAPSSLNCTPTTVAAPTMVTRALTGIEPPTVAPESGSVMATTRLPSCANASAGASAESRTNSRSAARSPVTE